jgi:hypothetical protein
MSGPRNRLAYERSQHVDGLIRELLRQHDPLARPLTAKTVGDALYCSHGIALAERTICWHIQRIRDGR